MGLYEADHGNRAITLLLLTIPVASGLNSILVIPVRPLPVSPAQAAERPDNLRQLRYNHPGLRSILVSGSGRGRCPEMPMAMATTT
jgi:hypothetical protein